MTRWAAAVVLALALAACSHHTANGQPAQPQNHAYMAGWNYAQQHRPADCSAGSYTLTMAETGAGSLVDWQDFEHAQGDFLAGCRDARGADS